MQDDFVNEAPRSAYVRVFVLATILSGLSIAIFLASVKYRADQVDSYYFVVFSTIILYLIITASFVAIYSNFSNIIAEKATPWVIAVSIFVVSIFLVDYYHEMSAPLIGIPSEASQYPSATGLHLAGLFCFNAFFFFWAKRRRHRPASTLREPQMPGVSGERSDSAGFLLPYEKKPGSDSPGTDSNRSMSPRPTAVTPVLGGPKKVDDASGEEQTAISELVELLSSDSASLEELLCQYPTASKAIEYLPDAETAWQDIHDLPSEYKEKFLSTLEANPKSDPAAQAELVKRSYERELSPFELQGNELGLCRGASDQCRGRKGIPRGRQHFW